MTGLTGSTSYTFSVAAINATGTGPSSEASNSTTTSALPTQRAIFGYGNASGGVTAITNLVSNTGVVATDTAGVGTTRDRLAAAG
jgi:hypothetical protein